MFQIWYDVYDASNLIKLDEKYGWWDQSHIHDIKYFVKLHIDVIPYEIRF